MSKEQLFNERVHRILTTTNHQEPDRVPILGQIETWAIAYAGSTIQECIDNPEKALTEVYPKPFRDIYFDATITKALSRDMKFYNILGNSSFFISEDGTTLQHDESITMDPEDYSELIKDPIAFFATNFIPKKYPDLTIEQIIEAIKQMIESGKETEKYYSYFKEELGIPVILSGGFAYAPLDFLFDHLRGFKGITIDLRRRPQQIVDAMEAIFPILHPMLRIDDNATEMEPFPPVSTMMHIPTFISPKQFEKYFAPLYEKMIFRAHEVGKKVFLNLEGDWVKHYDWLNSLPKNFAIGLMEHDDFIEAKKKIGNNITLAGGMSMDLLKYGTKQECLDYAKRIVDECAPGGGFIFSTDKSLLSPTDVKIENLIAVNQFVHEYGVYK